jgi:hypothetical protein
MPITNDMNTDAEIANNNAPTNAMMPLMNI